MNLLVCIIHANTLYEVTIVNNIVTSALCYTGPEQLPQAVEFAALPSEVKQEVVKRFRHQNAEGTTTNRDTAA